MYNGIEIIWPFTELLHSLNAALNYETGVTQYTYAVSFKLIAIDKKVMQHY